MRHAITTTATGFFSVTGRALQYALDPKQFLRNGLCIGGAICSVQLLHSVATTIGGSLDYLTSCLVDSKNSDTTNAIVGWIILAALLVHTATKGYRVYHTVIRPILMMQAMLASLGSQHQRQSQQETSDIKSALPNLAGAFTKHGALIGDENTVRNAAVKQEEKDRGTLMQNIKETLELHALTDELMADLQSANCKL